MKGATPQPMAGPRGRDRHAAPPPALRRRRQGTRGPPPLPPPLPIRPQSGRRQTEETAAPHPPRRGRCTRGAEAPRPRQAPARRARCRPTADRRRPGRRKRSGLIRGRPGRRGCEPGPPSPPPAALTRRWPTGPRPTPAAARHPPRREYTPGGHAGDNGRQADARRGGGAGGRPPQPPPPRTPPQAWEPQERPSAPPEPRGRPPPPPEGTATRGEEVRLDLLPRGSRPQGEPTPAWGSNAHQNSMEAAPHCKCG